MAHIKTRALLYTKGPKIQKFQSGSYFNDGKGVGAQFLENSNKIFQPSTNVFGSKNQFKAAKDFSKSLDTNPMQIKHTGYFAAPDNIIKMPSMLKPNSLEIKDRPKELAPNIETGISDTKYNLAGSLATQAGSALSNIDDGDATTYTGKEKAGDIAGGALKGIGTGISAATTASSLGLIGGAAATTATTAAAATTASAGVAGAGLAGAITIGQTAVPIPLVGAAIGAIVFGVVSWIGAGKKKKAARKAAKLEAIKVASQVSADNRKANTEQDIELTNGLRSTASEIPEIDSYSKREGGTFKWSLPKNISIKTSTATRKFKPGGKIKESENIIPNGVLHEEENSLGDKGMPVVKCKNNSCQKKYEIERDELILTLKTTKEIENLSSSKKYADLGNFVKDQVLNNTHSFTEKFVDLNNYTSN